MICTGTVAQRLLISDIQDIYGVSLCGEVREQACYTNLGDEVGLLPAPDLFGTYIS